MAQLLTLQLIRSLETGGCSCNTQWALSSFMHFVPSSLCQSQFHQGVADYAPWSCFFSLFFTQLKILINDIDTRVIDCIVWTYFEQSIGTIGTFAFLLMFYLLIFLTMLYVLTVDSMSRLNFCTIACSLELCVIFQ